MMHLLVGNPTAQSGRNAARIERARQLLAETGIAHDFLATAPHGATVELVARALRDGKHSTAIYMGGDGTFAEVAKGILASGRAGEVALGMLPTGTANDQGKSFNLGADEEALPDNVAVIARGLTCKLDVGRLELLDGDGQVIRTERFFDSAGWGISPRVLAVRNEDRKAIEKIPLLRALWRDQLVYAGALFRTFLASYVDDDKFDAELEVDGKMHLWPALTDLIVKGTRVYGGAWIFDDQARPDDGQFEVVPFAGKRDWISKAIVHLDGNPLGSQTLATVGVRHSESTRGAHIELRLRPHAGGLPLKAQIDGEELPASGRARIVVEPRALTLIVPEEFATA
jgi:diacylglycerol kinase family enzyme